MNAECFVVVAALLSSALDVSQAAPFLGYGYGLGGFGPGVAVGSGGASGAPVAVASSPVSIVSEAKSTNVGPVYSGPYGYVPRVAYAAPLHVVGYHAPYVAAPLVHTVGLGVDRYGYGVHTVGVGYGTGYHY
uniref:Glycine rich superfamily member n=1 Tax=Rhipicephalus appendiculatus TaxID=34631 RepID=A0A131YE26_RHIAP